MVLHRKSQSAEILYPTGNWPCVGCILVGTYDRVEQRRVEKKESELVLNFEFFFYFFNFTMQKPRSSCSLLLPLGLGSFSLHATDMILSVGWFDGVMA